MKNGVYGCLCENDHHRRRQHHDSFGWYYSTTKYEKDTVFRSFIILALFLSDFSETCESSSGSISVSRCQLFEAGFPADVLHLNDPRCKGTVRNGRVEFYFDNEEHICGTHLLVGLCIIHHPNIRTAWYNQQLDLDLILHIAWELKIRFISVLKRYFYVAMCKWKHFNKSDIWLEKTHEVNRCNQALWEYLGRNVWALPFVTHWFFGGPKQITLETT